jgi:predicted transcriptional regulator
MAKRRIDREMIGKFYKQGMTCSEIAKELNCGAPAVSKIIKTIRGAAINPTPVAITDARLLHLLQALYEHLWKLKEQGFPGAPKRLLLHRLRMLIAVVRGE